MDQAIASAKQYSDLLKPESQSAIYVFDEIFKEGGAFSGRRLKRKFTLLKNIDETVQGLLQEGEKVFFVTEGIYSSAAEQMFGGWAVYLLNRKAFVFTTHRIILIQIRGKGKPWELKTQIRYGAIRKLTSNFFGSMSVMMRTGRKMNFNGMPKFDRKYVSDMVQKFIESAHLEEVRTGEENLCPHCGVMVQGYPEICESCGKAFKSAKKAAVLSLVFPGLGDWYLGHRLFAGFEMFGAFVFWFAILLGAAQEVDLGAAAIMIGVVFIAMHGFDSIWTLHVGKKGIYPA